jgi:enoyl-CoA hydratase/carnithine racemase
MSNFRQRVELQINDGIARVLLDRPDKRNALDLDMFLAIVDAQKAIAQRHSRSNDVRVVLLSGAGADFCSGLDVKSMLKAKGNSIKLLWKWWPWSPNLAQRVSVGWRQLKMPVIACIHGNCWGGGLQIALGADFRLADPATSLSIMEGKWGLIPDMGGTLALRELMPRDQAMRLAMTAEVITAEQAQTLGLVTAVCEDVSAASQQLAQTLIERSPDAVNMVKRLYNKSWQGSEGYDALARETMYQVKVMAGKNQRIAVRRQRGEDIPYQ